MRAHMCIRGDGKLADSMKKGRHFFHCTPTALPRDRFSTALKLVAKEDTKKPTVYRRRSFPNREEVRRRSGEGLFRNRREGLGNIWGRTLNYFGESPSVRGSPIISVDDVADLTGHVLS